MRAKVLGQTELGTSTLAGILPFPGPRHRIAGSSTACRNCTSVVIGEAYDPFLPRQRCAAAAGAEIQQAPPGYREVRPCPAGSARCSGIAWRSRVAGFRLEALKGDRKGQYSIRINDQYRICFRWRDGDAHDVEIVDYR